MATDSSKKTIFAAMGSNLAIAIIAVVLARESKGLLVGESAAPQTIANIRSLSKTEPGVQEVIRVLTM
ncbi:hypothetical protein [Nostoc sp. PCC 9305]|uniref:hypothetical protein n=1 Tax=Nostoc sp. PCC 9305 TaxID=296636 RepID=UPI0039C73876